MFQSCIIHPHKDPVDRVCIPVSETFSSWIPAYLHFLKYHKSRWIFFCVWDYFLSVWEQLKELALTTLLWFKFIFWPCWALTEEKLQWEPCFILPPLGCYWKSWDESGQHRCCTLSLKAKRSAAIMFEQLGHLTDDFLLLCSKQKNTFRVDINFYNTAFKTKQPQNSIDCTQDGDGSKLEAACWHFSQKKKYILVCICTGTFYFSQDQCSSGGYSHLTQPEADTSWYLQCMKS